MLCATMSIPTAWMFAALAVLSAIVVSRCRRLRLPPGPKGVPLLGNVFDVPKTQEWKTYAQWSRQYGLSNPLSLFLGRFEYFFTDSDLIYLNLIGTPVIVVNSAAAATDLFEKRSSIYSDRYCGS